MLHFRTFGFLLLVFIVTVLTNNADVVHSSDIATGVTEPNQHDITHGQPSHSGDHHHGSSNGSDEHGNGTDHEEGDHHGHAQVHVAHWNFDYVSQYLILCMFILAVALLKMLFHWAEFLTHYIPESCVLIVFGVAVGAILQYAISPNIENISVDDLALQPKMFMLILLPPIVLDSAYSLNDKVFAENIGTILLYAVVGTVLNCFMIGPLLFGLAYSGIIGEIDITFVQCLLFASFIVAVDPVAVLAIFQEVGVNNVLYFLVFGESLLNDAVTVVLYNMMKAFNEMSYIPIGQIFLGLASFFTVSLGGLTIGILFGFVSSLISRGTHICRIVEPLVLLVMAYLSYLCAELVHWSGIISMIGCGIMQAQYAFHNLSDKSLTTVNYFIKMLSTLSDAVIFLFLGIEVLRTNHEWHTGFVISALTLCLVCRLFTVFGLTWLCNRHGRVKIISLEEQFIMWYGGLRGAVCFALCATLDSSFIHKNLFLTTTLLIVFFTVFVQGITIKPLVGLLKISRKHDDESHSLSVEFQSNVSVHVTAGVEVIIGNQSGNDFKDWVHVVNEKYLRHWLQNNPKTREEQFLEMYQKIAIKDHVNHIYEATSTVVKVNEFEDDEEQFGHRPRENEGGSDSDSSDLGLLASKEPSDVTTKKKKQGGTSEMLGYKELVGIMSASYSENFSKGVDRDIGGNASEMVQRLRQKHERLKENRRLRTPQGTPTTVRRRRTTSAGSASDDDNFAGDTLNHSRNHSLSRRHNRSGSRKRKISTGSRTKHELPQTKDYTTYNIEPDPIVKASPPPHPNGRLAEHRHSDASQLSNESSTAVTLAGTAASLANITADRDRNRHSAASSDVVPLRPASYGSGASGGNGPGDGVSNVAFSEGDSNPQHKTVIAITKDKEPYTTVVSGDGNALTKC